MTCDTSQTSVSQVPNQKAVTAVNNGPDTVIWCVTDANGDDLEITLAPGATSQQVSVNDGQLCSSFKCEVDDTVDPDPDPEFIKKCGLLPEQKLTLNLVSASNSQSNQAGEPFFLSSVQEFVTANGTPVASVNQTAAADTYDYIDPGSGAPNTDPNAIVDNTANDRIFNIESHGFADGVNWDLGVNITPLATAVEGCMSVARSKVTVVDADNGSQVSNLSRPWDDEYQLSPAAGAGYTEDPTGTFTFDNSANQYLCWNGQAADSVSLSYLQDNGDGVALLVEYYIQLAVCYLCDEDGNIVSASTIEGDLPPDQWDDIIPGDDVSDCQHDPLLGNFSSVVTGTSITWTVPTAQNTPLRICYREVGTSVWSYQPCEPSFNFGDPNDIAAHQQTIVYPNPNTTYEHMFQTSSTFASNCSEHEWFDLTCEPVTATTDDGPPIMEDHDDGRQQFWESQGFIRFWGSTPTAAQVGQPANQYFATSSFTNGQTLINNLIGNYNTDNPEHRAFITDELGKPAIKVESEPGDRNQLLITGTQLFGTEFNEVIFSHMVFNPCGAANGQLLQGPAGGVYQGRGSYWGSDASLNRSGGSTNYPDSWNVRVPFDGSTARADKDWLYIYPSRPASSTQIGLVINPVPGAPNKACGIWQRVETRILQNTPASSSNGLVEHYVDGQLVVQWAGQLRLQNDVWPKGMGILVQLRDSIPQTLYFCDFEIFVK